VEARHHAEVRFCTEQEKTPPSTSPKLRVQFVVSPTGSVDTVEVSERSNVSERLEKCLVQAVRRWTFKEPTGGSARASLLLKR
jgi:TonB family protein